MEFLVGWFIKSDSVFALFSELYPADCFPSHKNRHRRRDNENGERRDRREGAGLDHGEIAERGSAIFSSLTRKRCRLPLRRQTSEVPSSQQWPRGPSSELLTLLAGSAVIAPLSRGTDYVTRKTVLSVGHAEGRISFLRAWRCGTSRVAQNPSNHGPTRRYWAITVACTALLSAQQRRDSRRPILTNEEQKRYNNRHATLNHAQRR